MRDKIKAIFDKYTEDISYTNDVEQFGISEHDYDGIIDDLVKLFPIHNVISDEINMEWLMKKHPQLTRYEAIKLKEFSFEHTIRLKDCYGDGQIMLPKWRESIRQN